MIVKRDKKKKRFKPIGQNEKFEHIDWAKDLIENNPESSLDDLMKQCPDNDKTQLYVSALSRLYKDKTK